MKPDRDHAENRTEAAVTCQKIHSVMRQFDVPEADAISCKQHFGLKQTMLNKIKKICLNDFLIMRPRPQRLHERVVRCVSIEYFKLNISIKFHGDCLS